MYEELKPHIALREQMSKQYGIDLRSNSDAQIAENVIKHELEAKNIDCTRPTVKIGTKYKYTTPKHITFKKQLFNDLVAMIERTDFVVNDNGQVALPDDLLTKITFDGSEIPPFT